MTVSSLARRDNPGVRDDVNRENSTLVDQMRGLFNAPTFVYHDDMTRARLLLLGHYPAPVKAADADPYHNRSRHNVRKSLRMEDAQLGFVDVIPLCVVGGVENFDRSASAEFLGKSCDGALACVGFARRIVALLDAMSPDLGVPVAYVCGDVPRDALVLADAREQLGFTRGEAITEGVFLCTTTRCGRNFLLHEGGPHPVAHHYNPTNKTIHRFYRDMRKLDVLMNIPKEVFEGGVIALRGWVSSELCEVDALHIVRGIEVRGALGLTETGSWPYDICGMSAVAWERTEIWEAFGDFCGQYGSSGDRLEVVRTGSFDSHLVDGKFTAKPYECDVCEAEFAQKANLFVHMRVHTGDKPFECSVCAKTFSQAGNLSGHMRRHKGERPFTCYVCEKTFIDSGSLSCHLRVHTGDRPYKCGDCDKRFARTHHLSSHQRTHTGERPYKCGVCQLSFATTWVLSQHGLVHTGERPHKCSVCSRNFTHSSHLIQHMRTHSGERPYKCDVCNQSFIASNVLLSHMRTHSGERPYTCNTCHQSFSQSSGLRRHVRTHSGEKPYKCTLCEMTFASGGGLHTHIRTHTGERPYPCTQCQKSFSQTSTLSAHMRTHTGERHKCAHCFASFASSGNRAKHERTQHQHV